MAGFEKTRAGSSRAPVRQRRARARGAWLESALALLIIGLARPQLVEAKEIVKGEGIDIALALDISGSMASLDFQPANRLEAAKRVIADFIDQRTYDRIGLVVFAEEAFNQSPLTTDHAVLDRLLERVELAPDLKIEDGTAIGLGIANAANMIKDSNAKSRVVILLTDGVNNAGQIDPQTAADAAQALGIKVYTIGMGRTGQVPVPVTDVFGGKQIIYQESQIDEASLQAIADKTGALYFRAEDTQGLQQIYARINELEKSQVEITNFEARRIDGMVIDPRARARTRRTTFESDIFPTDSIIYRTRIHAESRGKDSAFTSVYPRPIKINNVIRTTHISVCTRTDSVRDSISRVGGTRTPQRIRAHRTTESRCASRRERECARTLCKMRAVARRTHIVAHYARAPTVGRNKNIRAAKRRSSDGRARCFQKHVGGGFETESFGTRQNGNQRSDDSAQGRRNRSCAIQRREFHPLSAHQRLQHCA